jgi:acetyl esterase/lipase
MPPGILSILVATTGLQAATERGAGIRLWPNGAPGANGETPAEVSLPSLNPKLPKNFTGVHQPASYAFLPERPNGVAAVAAPGGGHTQLVVEKEGWDIAKWLNRQGIAAFVLKYRLARTPGSRFRVVERAGADAARAVRRERRGATRCDAGRAGSGPPVERESSRPDFAMIVYPGFGPGNRAIPKNAPPAFLVCADDDRSHAPTTLNFYLDLRKQGVSSEMQSYAPGGHGFARWPSTLPATSWPDRLPAWLADRKLLKK